MVANLQLQKLLLNPSFLRSSSPSSGWNVTAETGELAPHTLSSFSHSGNSQSDDISMGCFHGDGQRVLTPLISSVLIGSSLQEQTHLTMRTRKKTFSWVSSYSWWGGPLVGITQCDQQRTQRAALPDLSGLDG